MILAAGLGTRMRPLTDHTPKPLLKAAGKPLIKYHIESLVAAGITDIVVNTSWLGSQIADYLGDGSEFGASVHLSHEDTPLETAGGIIKALPFLTNNHFHNSDHKSSDDFFVVVNGDVWTDFNYLELTDIANSIKENNQNKETSTLAHLVMVNNPPQHPTGDFYLLDSGDDSDDDSNDNIGNLSESENQQSERLTFSGISLLNKNLFKTCGVGAALLAPLLREAMKTHQVTGHKANCTWMDIGTPERLSLLEKHLKR